MQRIEEKKFRNNLILVSVIAALFSSFTLWLIESPIKYSFFVFETILIIVLYVMLRNYDLKFNTSRFLITKLPSGIFLDISLVFFSVVIILFNVFQIETIVQLPIVFACTAFLAGYALLNICKLKKYFTRLETFVLSFFIGFIFTSFSTLVLLWLDESFRIILIPIFFIILAIISAFRHLRNNEETTSQLNSLSKKVDILAIGAAISFYILFFYFIYPEFSLLPSSDITKHFRFSMILSNAPDFYGGFSYILFHSFDSTVNTLSGGSSFEYFQTVKIFLNLFLPLTVYAFSKRFLEKVDKRIPAISTLLYSVFSNFSFLYYLQLKLQDTDETVISLLRDQVAEKAYFGTINFIQPFPWVVPQSIGLMIFVFLLLLLGIRDIPRSRLIPLMTILILSLFLIHLPQALIFIIFLSIFSFISTSKSLRLKEGLISSVIALTGFLMVIAYTDFSWEPVQRIHTFPSMVFFYSGALIPLAGFALFWRKKILYKLHFLKEIKLSVKFFRILSILLVSFYLIALLTWFFIDFESSVFVELGVVPWFVYPLILGILGLLSLVSIRYLGHILPNNFVFLILMLLLIMVVLGQIISYVNVNLSPTNFWEKRLLIYVFLAASLLAPIPLLRFVDGIGVKRKFLSNITIMVIISVIVISGFSSMALQSEYWYLQTNRLAMEKDEVDALTTLKEVLNSEKRAFTVSPSITSMRSITYAAPPYQQSQPGISYYSKGPDMPLFTLRAHNLPHAYLYLHERDLSLLNDKESWLLDHYIPLLPVTFANNKATIYNASRISFPLSQSDTTLIIPYDPRISQDSWLFAYDMISQNEINYTVMYDIDQNVFNSKTVLLSYDPPTDDYQTDFVDDFTRPNKWKFHSGEWNYSNDGLHGTFDPDRPNHIVTSPIVTRDAIISTSFKILSADPKLANYVSIVYDWQDPDNFSLAKVKFQRDNVNVLFDTVKDGNLSVFPKWPGLMTTLDWKTGDLFNMTLSKQGKTEALFLNGTKYLIHQGSEKSGNIGFSVHRTKEVFFDHFSIQQMNKLNQRNFSDYLSYVSSGGHLIVLNTNGNGQFSSIFLNSEDSSTTDRISNYNDVSSNVEVLEMTKFKNILPKDFHNIFQGYSSILVSEKSIGSGKITFLNVYPFISDFNEGKIQGNNLYIILGKLLDSINLDKLDSKPISSKNIQLSFKSMEGYGNVRVDTDSLLFPNDLRLTRVVIRHNDNDIAIKNVNGFTIEDYNKVVLRSNQVSLANGNGLYSKIILGDSVKLNFPKKNSIVTLISDDEPSLRFEKVSRVGIINEQPIEVIVRQPKIVIHGNTTINEPISGKLYTIIRTNAESLKVSGNVTMSMFMSDTFSLAKSIDLKGFTERVPPLLDKEDYSILLNFSESIDIHVLVIPFLLIPFIISAVFLAYTPNQKMNYN